MRPRGTYTVRRSGGIFSSIFGVLLGLGFIVIGSPVAVWYAESQHQGEDFATAIQVAATDQQSGYLAVTGTASVVDALPCPSQTVGLTTDCVWVQTEQQTYRSEEKRQCGSLSDDQTILSNLPDECDSDGTNCERCYQVEEHSWETVDTTDQFAQFGLGVYSVTPTSAVNFIGEDSFTTTTATTPQVGDQRQIMTYYPVQSVALVAGLATNNKLGTTLDGKPFVVSNLDYAGTLADLEAQDRSMMWILRIVSLVLMVIGMTMLAGPLTYFTNIFRVIPFLGSRVDRGFDAVIGFVAALLGVVMWFVLWIVVLLLKNIWLILGGLVIIAIIVVILIQLGKKKAAATPAPTITPAGQ